ncbi:MAG: type II secretion system F family protein, partial [Pirellulaceae bacterium]|nr:type II secretion system F family protein [Pirellulaceae bacterium]
MNSLGPLNTAGLLVLGVAVLWTVRLVYGVRGAQGEDLMRRLLLVTGWMLVVTGALGVLAGLLSWLSLGFWLLALIVVLMTLARYQDCERRSLLWTLAIAAEKQIPLSDAVRSLADERPWSLSGRVTRLAEQLERGVPLPKALHESRNPLPMDAELAVRFGAETGQMGPALRQVLQHVDLVEMTVRTAIEKLLYMIFVTLSSLVLLVFYAVFVMSRFQALMGSFNVAPPPLTVLVFSVCDSLATWWPVLIPLLVLLPLLAVVSLLYYVGWLNHNLPLLGWIWLRYDSGLLLRCLALAVGQRRSVGATLGMLAVRFPRASTRRRLRAASRR